MKRTSFRRAALLACVALTAGMTLASCEKENYGGTIRLNAEKLSGDGKTYVEGVDMGWVDGDLIKFNATTCTVSNGAATGIPEDVDLIAFYPNTISSANAPSNSVSVTVPSEYTYSYSDGHQILALPMVGKASSGDESITMKHLCSAMEVTVTNDFSEGLVLDSIILRRSGLSGTTTVNLSGSDPVPGAGDVDSVRMAFSGTTIAANGGSLTVQIPVLPVAEGTATRVSVRGHLATSGTAYRYSRSTNIALGRAMVHAAPVTMTTPAQGNHMEEIVVSTVPEGAINGLFSVGPTKQVYFSKGNLVYNPDGSDATQWYFHTNQYDRVFTSNGTYTTGATDHLCWGATGLNSLDPVWSTGLDGNSVLSGDNDWGTAYNNANGTSGWRTLSQTEWNHLFNVRDGHDDKYGSATVNGVFGVVILPDNWTLPSGLIFNSGMRGEDNNNYDTENWAAMEAAGAVFLPGAGNRLGSTVDYVGYGFYWSSTPNGGSDDYAYTVLFGVDDLLAGIDYYRFYGQSVRLVQDK